MTIGWGDVTAGHHHRPSTCTRIIRTATVRLGSPVSMVNRSGPTTEAIVKQFVICLFRGQQMAPVLYYIPPSPPCRTVLLLGRLLEIDFDLKPVNIQDGDQMKPEFVQVRVLQFITGCTGLILLSLFLLTIRNLLTLTISTNTTFMHLNENFF